MASRQPNAQSMGSDEAADLEKAFQELAKGERTATALENQLSKMEARIQALLDQAESEQKEVAEMKKAKASSSDAGHQAEPKDNDSAGKNS